jgi:large subunit ribosomal protein L10
VAKTITTFRKEHEVLEFKGGLMDGEPLDVDSFNAIAKLPGLDVLHGQLVGLAASPLTGLVAGMSNLISGLGRQLAQIAEQGLVTGEAPPAEEPAAEAPEPEAPVEEPTPAEEPAPDDAPVEEPPEEESPPEPEASGEEPEAEVENDNPEEVEAEGETSSGPEVEAEGETSEGQQED